MVRAFFLLKKYLLILQWRVSCAAVHHGGSLFSDRTEVCWANSSEGFTVLAHLPGLTVCGRHCAMLAVLPCFASPKPLLCMRSCCSRGERRHQCTAFMRVVTQTPLGQESCWRAPGLCSSGPTEGLLYSKERGGRKQEDMMLMWKLCSQSGIAGAWGQGQGPPSPRRDTLMSPGCTDTGRATPLPAIPSMGATHEISLP